MAYYRLVTDPRAHLCSQDVCNNDPAPFVIPINPSLFTEYHDDTHMIDSHLGLIHVAYSSVQQSWYIRSCGHHMLSLLAIVDGKQPVMTDEDIELVISRKEEKKSAFTERATLLAYRYMDSNLDLYTHVQQATQRLVRLPQGQEYNVDIEYVRNIAKQAFLEIFELPQTVDADQLSEMPPEHINIEMARLFFAELVQLSLAQIDFLYIALKCNGVAYRYDRILDLNSEKKDVR